MELSGRSPTQHPFHCRKSFALSRNPNEVQSRPDRRGGRQLTESNLVLCGDLSPHTDDLLRVRIAPRVSDRDRFRCVLVQRDSVEDRCRLANDHILWSVPAIAADTKCTELGLVPEIMFQVGLRFVDMEADPVDVADQCRNSAVVFHSAVADHRVHSAAESNETTVQRTLDRVGRDAGGAEFFAIDRVLHLASIGISGPSSEALVPGLWTTFRRPQVNGGRVAVLSTGL